MFIVRTIRNTQIHCVDRMQSFSMLKRVIYIVIIRLLMDCLVIRIEFYVVRQYPSITVAVRSKECTVFARSETGIVGSNPNQGMDASMCVYSVFVLFCV
jgi:hypothetical protein